MRRLTKFYAIAGTLLLATFIIMLRAQFTASTVNRWTPTADMSAGRASACSVALADGRVMVAGGAGDAGAVATVEMYDSTGTFTAAAPMQQARMDAACATMADGRVMVAGGSDGKHALASIEIYDPQTSKWTAGTNLSQPRNKATATLLPWGTVLIAGGDNDGTLSETIELYQPWIDHSLVVDGALSQARTQIAVAPLADNRVLLLGGSNGAAPVANVDLYDANTNTLSSVGMMSTARANHAATALPDGTVLVTGGTDAGGNALATTEIFDVAQRKSTPAANMGEPRSKHMAFLLPKNNHVLITGGVSGSRLIPSSELYTPWRPGFSQTAPLTVPRQAAAATAMRRGAIIVAGGSNSSGYLNRSEIYRFATVTTDQDDYKPGQVANISGDGWQAGEQVQITAIAANCAQHTTEFTAAVTADSRGHITTGGFNIDKSHLGMKFYLTAKGSASEAMTTFTDGVAITTFTLATSANPTAWAAQPTFTVHVIGDAGTAQVPTGTVQLVVDGVPSTSAVLSTFNAGTWDASAAIPGSIAPGLHNVTVKYLGDVNYNAAPNPAPSPASINQTITATTSATVSNISSNPVVVGQGFTLTATVSDTSGAGSAVNGGTVTFTDTTTANTIGTTGATSGGTASLVVAAPPASYFTAGAHNITATFNGGNGYAASGASPAVALNINPSDTSIAVLDVTGSPTAFGTAVTYSATPVATSPGASTNIPITGSVKFFDNGILQATNALVAGTATFTTAASYATGTHTVTAQYVASTNFNGSTSAQITHTVNSIATTTTVAQTGGTNPSLAASGVSFTATVDATAACPATCTLSTGNVVFSSSIDGVLATVPVTSTGANTGKATASLNGYTALHAGSHTITATYTDTTSPATYTTSAGNLPIPLVISGTTVSINVTLGQTASQPYGSNITYIATLTASTTAQPTGTVQFYDNGAPVGGLITAAGAGPNTSTATLGPVSTYAVGTHVITAQYTSNALATFASQSSSNSVSQAIVQATTTTTVTSPSPIAGSPQDFGVAVTFKAQVASNSGAIPPGTIQFVDTTTNTVLGSTSYIVDGTGAASVTLSNLQPGNKQIVATFTATNTANFASSSNSATPLAYTINKITPSVSLALSPASPTAYQAFTATATFTPVQGVTPTGNAQLLIDGLTVGSLTAINTGQVVFNNAGLAAGAHTFTVNYSPSGDLYYKILAGAGSLPKTFATTATTTTVTSSAAPSNSIAYGAPVTLTATIATPGVTAGTIGGTVAFVTSLPAANTAITGCSAVTPSNGVATCSVTTPLPVGTNSIKATYSGDSNFAGSDNSASLYSLVVSNIPTTTSLSAAPNSISLGQSTTYTVSVNGTSSGSGNPTGSVTVFDATNLPATPVPGCTGLTPLSATNPATITCTPTYGGTGVLNGGSHSLYATYTPTGNFASSSSSASPITLTVAKATAVISGTIGLTSNSINYNGADTATVTINAASGGPAPTGTISLYDGATLIGTTAVVVPSTTFDLSALPAAGTKLNQQIGTHTLSAQYSGDANYSAVNVGGPTASLVVSKFSPSLTSISYLPATAKFGTSVTLSALVSNSGVGSGAAAPGGTLTFTYNATTLGTCNLAAATCNLVVSTTALPIGADTITVAYSGDTNYGTASNNSNSITIIKNDTTGTLTTSPSGTAALNQSVTLTATFTPANSGVGVPTGTVTFTDTTAGVTLGTGNLNASGVATLTTSAITPGASKTITATWPGDTNFNAPGTAPTATLTVSTGTTVVTLTPTPASVPLGSGAGSTVTFNVSVTGGPSNVAPIGSVTILDGGGAIGGSTGTCTSAITLVAGSGNTSNGSCTIVYDGSTATRSSGTHNMTAAYTASGASVGVVANATSGTQTVTVGANTATIATPFATASVGSLPLVWGQQATITVTVSGLTPPTVSNALTGSVNFFDGVTLLNASPIALTVNGGTNVGTATLPAQAFSVGSHTITAQYLGSTSGNPSYASGTSTALSLVVGQAGTTTSLTPTVTTMTWGVGNTLNSTVAVTGSASGTPTGTVSFKNGATVMGTGTLAGGSTSFNLSTQLTPSASAYSITAAYGGDTNAASSTSTPAVAITVNKNTVAGSLTTSPSGTATLGASVVLTATFGAASGGAGVPSGTVTFVDSVSGTLGTASLNASGVATLTTSALTPTNGTPHTLTANYSGDSFFQATTAVSSPASPTTTLAITQGNTTVTLTSSLNPATVTQTVTYNFSVTGGPSSPTGTVALFDGVTKITTCGSSGDITLTAPATGNTSTGSCAVTYAGGTVGNHNITATYTPTVGSSNWAAATSSVVTETVNKLQPTLSSPTVNTGAVVSTCLPNICVPYGTLMTISASVSPVNPTPAYTGAFTLIDNNATMSGSSFDAPTGVVSVSNVRLPGGTHVLKANFAGDANYLSADPAITITIGPLSGSGFISAGGTFALSPNPINTTYGGAIPQAPQGPVTVTMTPPAGYATPTGNVTLAVNAVSLGTYPLNAGVATITNSSLPTALLAGTNQTLTITYSGDSNYSSGNPPAAPTNLINVAQATPTIALGASPNASSFNQNVVFTVTATSPTGVGQPTGSVDIYDCLALAVPCGSPTKLTTTPILLANGTGTFSIASLATGTHNVYALYAGDTNFKANTAATAPTVGQVVNAGGVTVALTPSTTNAALNSSVTLSVTVTGGSAPPQGTVTIVDNINGGADAVNTCTLVALAANPAPPANSSSASCSINYNNSDTVHGPGTHGLTANFASSNTANWSNASSAVKSVTIGKASTSVAQPTVTGTQTYGNNLTFAAVVTPTTANPNYAPNTLQFYDNGTPLGGPVNVSSTTGIATFTTTTPLPAGNHTITAQFIGDTNYGSSAVSPNLSITIGKATPATTFSAGPFPVYNVTYAGTLTTGQVQVAGAAGALPPSGTVTASSGAITIGTGTLAANGSNGQFTFTNVALPASINSGNQNLTITYSGDSNYLPGTALVSNPGLNVAAAPSTVVVSSAPLSTVAYGQNVTFTATFTGAGNAINSGTITFTSDGNAINATCTAGSGQFINNNVATCTVAATTANKLSAGVHTITVTAASFTDPSGNHSLITANITPLTNFVVGAPAPQITISSNANPSQYGQAVTFTAVASGTSGTPIGQMQFFDGSGTLGALLSSVSTTATSATYTLTVPSGSLPLLTGGTHAISATYVPLSAANVADTNYGQGTSQTQTPPSVLQQVVNRGNSQVINYLVTATPVPIVYGESVTIQADIAPAAGNTGVPTGIVLFKDGGTQIGQAVTIQTVGLVQRATLSNYTLFNPGNHLITVEYQGDQNFNASATAQQTLTVAQDSTKTTLDAFPANPTFGANITLGATVCGLQPGSATTCGNTFAQTPGGTVTFLDGSTVLGQGNVDSNGRATLTINMAAPPFASPAIGNHNITARYDGDTRFLTSTSAAGVLAIAKAVTNSSVSSNANPAVTGQSITFTAAVAAPGSFATAPTGTVSFFDGGTLIGTTGVNTNGGTTQATLVVPSNGISALTIGQHVISVTYSGDATYATSSSPLSAPSALVQNVNKASTTTTLQSSSNASNVGQQITLTATVSVNSPGTGTPTGSVQFINTSSATQPTVIGTSPLIVTPGPNGTNLFIATLNLATLPQGNPVLIATYSGDNNYLTSTSSNLTQAVQKTPTSIQLTSSLSPSILGNQVTFGITVSPVPPGTGTPTGQVQIYDGTQLLATATLQGGQYQYVTSSLAVGLHAIGVQYLGDTNFQPFTSPTISQVVNKVPTSLNMTSNAVTAVASQVITFTATLSPNPVPGVSFAQGQVGFYDGANLMGVSNLQSNVAVLNVSNLSVGLHQVSAIYLGDDNWAGATSGFFAQTITLASTNTAIISSANPSVFGQPVTFTISVSVPFPGTVPAQGQVQLFDNNNALGDPLNAANGVFTTTVTNFTPGTHSIVAKFLANTSFSGSVSATLPQVINKAPTVTTLAVMPNGSTSKQQVTMTAVVTIPSPGAGTPTGSVQFADTSFNKILGTAPIQFVGGVYTATLTTDQLNQSGAPQILVATYSGDNNFASSSSNPQGQSVFGSQIAVVNGAAYTSTNFANDSWATVYGENLANTQLTAVTTPYPTSLAGTTITLTDAAGTQRLAPIYFVSPGQVNFLIPSNTAFGLATVTLTNPSGATASTVILVTRTAPGIFTANASGTGVAAALVQRVRSDGSQSIENVAAFDGTANVFVPTPITVGSDQLFLQLYGTGIRYTPGLNKVTCTINGKDAQVLYASAAPGFFGLDQVNVKVPDGMAGAGTVNVVVTVDGQASNTVTLNFK